MKEQQIPVVSYEEFRRLATANSNLLHENPWVVSGYIESWAGYRCWQDLEYLRTRFGHLNAFAKAPNFVTNRKASLVSVETTFAQYIDYIRHPARAKDIYAGCWRDGTYDDFVEQGLPLYCGTLRIVHRAGDAILQELSPLVPAPMETWNDALPYYYSLFNHFWLLVSLPEAITPLHTDNNGTIAMIAQLKGRKRATLYSPRDLQHVYNPEVGFLDPFHPDESDFPTWKSAVPWTCDICDGQVLFVGTNWAHHVRSVEASISVSFDFVNASNIAAYATSPQWAEVLGRRIMRNPGLINDAIANFDRPAVQCEPIIVGRHVMAGVLRSFLAGAEPGGTRTIRRSYLDHLERVLP